MPNSLRDAVSPYLRSHSDNPVAWREWGAGPFEEARRRGVPVLVSIGYATCHWCHVMARESFSDPAIALKLNASFVAIKVDREEYPDVDSSYLAAAAAFTGGLGWPLNVFVTPEGKAFYAGTYWPPAPAGGRASFDQVLDAVIDAWTNRRDEVDANASTVAAALAAQVVPPSGELPEASARNGVVAELVENEDIVHGGFGGAPKFPVAPVIGFLQNAGDAGSTTAAELAERTLAAMAASPLRDGVEGGFFRYSTRRDWSDPHYERMLYDNALLLGCYSRSSGDIATGIAAGIASFLGTVLRTAGGAFASGQDSESTVGGQRVEGGYYLLDAAARAREVPPALDDKILTGWNGLAIEALASAGARHGRSDWIDLARGAADHLLDRHVRADGTLIRASVGDRDSRAPATLEDYGMFASGLLALSLATGESAYAVTARSLVDLTLATAPERFAVPGGADAVLTAQGASLDFDPSEGAYPSGLSAISAAAHTLYLLTARDGYRAAAVAAMRSIAPLALSRPISFGAALGVIAGLQVPPAQLVVVGDPASGLAARARRAPGLVAAVTDAQAGEFSAAGFELFAGRISIAGQATAYLCRDFLCRLPVVELADLEAELTGTE